MSCNLCTFHRFSFSYNKCVVCFFGFLKYDNLSLTLLQSGFLVVMQCYMYCRSQFHSMLSVSSDCLVTSVLSVC